MTDLLERIKHQVLAEMDTELAQSMNKEQLEEYLDKTINEMSHTDLLSLIGYMK